MPSEKQSEKDPVEKWEMFLDRAKDCLDEDDFNEVRRRCLMVPSAVRKEVLTFGRKGKIEIEFLEVPTDPPVKIYHVEIHDDTGSWNETFGSLELLNAFLRGLSAGASMVGKKIINLPVFTQ